MKTKLIALVALAAGTVAGIDGDLSADAEFEVDAGVAESLLNDGKAKLANPAPAATRKERSLKVRVLVDCVHGKANGLVELPESVAKQAEKDGHVDTDKAAVAYAAKLAQNQKDEG